MFYKRYLKFKTGYKDVTDIALRHKNTLKMSKKLESGNESYIQFNFYYIYVKYWRQNGKLMLSLFSIDNPKNVLKKNTT